MMAPQRNSPFPPGPVSLDATHPSDETTTIAAHRTTTPNDGPELNADDAQRHVVAPGGVFIRQMAVFVEQLGRLLQSVLTFSNREPALQSADACSRSCFPSAPAVPNVGGIGR